MNERQREAALELVIGWLEKASVGCVLVGMFQTDHMFGGIIGSVVAFLIALCLKIRGRK